MATGQNDSIVLFQIAIETDKKIFKNKNNYIKRAHSREEIQLLKYSVAADQ